MGKIFIPYDSIVMVIEEDAHIPIILGCPFLATIDAMIDVKSRRLSLQVGKKKLEFNLSKARASPSLEDACYRVDVLEKVALEDIKTLSPPLDPFEAYLIGTYANGVDSYPNEEREIYAKILNWA